MGGIELPINQIFQISGPDEQVGSAKRKTNPRPFSICLNPLTLFPSSFVRTRIKKKLWEDFSFFASILFSLLFKCQ